MTQEHIMKKKMIRAVIFSIITSLALAVFIGLYIDEKHRVQETYRLQFNTELEHAALNIDNYIEAEGDFDAKYRQILASVSCADSYAFLLENLTEEQKITMNEISSALIRFPVQMSERERMEKLGETMRDLQSNLDKGFEEAAGIVAELDRKGK